MNDLLDRLVPFSTEEEWLAARSGIGGSDVPKLLGVYDWKNAPGREDLKLELMGLKEPEDLSQKPQVCWGNRLEEAVARAYVLEVDGYEPGPCEESLEGRLMRCRWTLVRDREYPEVFSCTPDFLLIGEGETDIAVEGALEIKTTNWSSQWQKAHGSAFPKEGATLEVRDIPSYVNLQVQHSMMVTGLDHWTVACMCTTAVPLLWKRVPRNQELIDLIRREGLRLWNEVRRG